MKKFILAIACIIVLGAVLLLSKTQPANAQAVTPESTDISPRNQLYGDPHSAKALAPLPLPEGIAPPSAALPDETDPSGEIMGEYPEMDAYQDMVMQSYRDSTWEIYKVEYIVDNDYREPTRITYNAAFDGEPQLSTGCTGIVFTSDRDGNDEIYTMDPDGGSVSRLTWDASDDYNPTWSVDGTEIAFVSERDGNAEIYTMKADGSGLLRLTASAEADFSPVYAPDGLRIAWIRAIDSQYGVIIIANRDGSNPQTISGPLRFLSDLTWSPTGAMLAFDFDSNGDGWNEVATILLDGSDLQIRSSVTAYKDGLAGSISASGKNLYYTDVNYWLYQGVLYITDVTTRRTGLVDNVGSGTIFANRLDFYVDVKTNDTTFPQSQIYHLPAYSRASGFTLLWGYYDPGPATVYRTDFQYRYGTTGDWVFFAGVLIDEMREITFSGTPGETVYFRSQAEDDAEHWEPWPEGNGDTWTTLITWILCGAVTDPRGAPLPGVTVDLTPAGLYPLTTNSSGSFQAYLIEEGEHILSSQRAGYGALPASTMDISRDSALNIYLPAEINWMSNGGFESQPDPFESWVLTGEISPSMGLGHSGETSVQLGVSCTPPCLNDPHTLDDNVLAPESDPLIVADQFGNVHVLYDNNHYMMRDTAGNWSTPETIGGLGDPGNLSFRGAMAIDQTGAVHVLVTGNSVFNLYYYRKPAGGTWQDGFLVTGSRGQFSPAVAINAVGTVVVVYSEFGKTFYMRHPAGEGWSTPQTIYSSLGVSASLAVLPDGTIKMLIGRGGESGACIRTFASDGTLLDGTDGCVDHIEEYLQLAAGPDGTLHMVGYSPTSYMYYWYYYSLSPSGVWSEPMLGINQTLDISLAVDPEGTVHILAQREIDSAYPVYYYRRAANESGFSQAISHEGTFYGNITLTCDPDGQLHAAYSEFFTLYYMGQISWPVDGSSAVSTSLTVPADAHRPTLSFMYRIEGMVGAQPLFSLGFSTGITNPVTTVFSATQSTPWTLGWVDLTDWAGQTVSLTFALSAPQDSPIALAWVDSISAGEWWTPVITDITPIHFEYEEGGLLTIYGDNLPITPTVMLGDVTLTDVTIVDEHTLQVAIPIDTPVGRHLLTVLSPEGQVGVAPERVSVGHITFMPIITTRLPYR